MVLLVLAVLVGGPTLVCFPNSLLGESVKLVFRVSPREFWNCGSQVLAHPNCPLCNAANSASEQEATLSNIETGRSCDFALLLPFSLVFLKDTIPLGGIGAAD